MINSAYHSSESWTTVNVAIHADRITEEGLYELIDSNKDVLLYGFDKEIVAGCVSIRQDGLLSMLAVHPGHQSKGMKVAEVQVFEYRHELLTWYRRMGFKDDGEVIPFHDKSLLIVEEAPLVVLKV